ncbi:MAG: 4-hydroxy-tetrahydrodipicolinate reductase [Oscillospiraceae bacterium]|jgi:4-hydroxy-tetrahydrodipicolinate reductase|nr:4-hydroxy-tetrahydrodipicolinate reductase [Oscillospiraceae bacterium]
MIDVIICGCNGKMGKVLTEITLNKPEYKIVAGIDIKARPYYDIPVFRSFSETTVLCDVIIDFSSPDALQDILEYAEKNKTALVLCTTGYSDDQVKKIKKASSIIPIFSSRNMSIGVNLMIELSKQAAKVLGGDFDIEIIEKHHNQKTDAPSGTALMIAEEISKCTENETKYIYDRHCRKEKRNKSEIGIHSVRGGNIIGEHEVVFAGDSEVLTVMHQASSRDLFAQGALKCCEFIKGKDAGMYNMKDLVNCVL